MQTNTSGGSAQTHAPGEAALTRQPFAKGDLISVRFGRAGSQVARVERDLGGFLRVEKWRDNSRRWTCCYTVDAREVLGPANLATPAAMRAQASLKGRR